MQSHRFIKKDNIIEIYTLEIFCGNCETNDGTKPYNIIVPSSLYTLFLDTKEIKKTIPKIDFTVDYIKLLEIDEATWSKIVTLIQFYDIVKDNKERRDTTFDSIITVLTK